MRQRRRPTTRNAARALGADPDQLRHFVEYHPDPDTAALLAATDTSADALDRADRELVGEWLADRLDERFTADDVRETLRQHGTVGRRELSDLIDHDDPNGRVGRAVRQLREAGEIDPVKTDWGLTTGYRLADDDTDGAGG